MYSTVHARAEPVLVDKPHVQTIIGLPTVYMYIHVHVLEKTNELEEGGEVNVQTFDTDTLNTTDLSPNRACCE